MMEHMDLNLNVEIGHEAVLGPHKRKPTAKILAALEDVLPEGPGSLPPDDPPHGLTRCVILHISEKLRTKANRFSLSRQ